MMWHCGRNLLKQMKITMAWLNPRSLTSAWKGSNNKREEGIQTKTSNVRICIWHKERILNYWVRNSITDMKHHKIITISSKRTNFHLKIEYWPFLFVSVVLDKLSQLCICWYHTQNILLLSLCPIPISYFVLLLLLYKCKAVSTLDCLNMFENILQCAKR